MNKICSNCKILKDIIGFNKIKNKHSSWCKSCISIYKKKYHQINKQKISNNKREYYLKNKDKIINNNKKHYQLNKLHKKEYDKKRLASDPEKFLQQKRNYYYANKSCCIERVRKYANLQYKTNLHFKLKNRISSGVRKSLNKLNLSKNNLSILSFLPYTIDELKQHLESQFKPWMNWNNYGTYRVEKWNNSDLTTWTWQIDHIVPQSDLLYTSMSDDNFKKCWALSNLRPYSSKLNLLDGINRTRHGENNE